MTDEPRAASNSLQQRSLSRIWLRIGLSLFGGGVLFTSICGIAINFLSQGAPERLVTLERFRRGGLVVMLVGMVVILFCFPMAQWMWKRIQVTIDRWSELKRISKETPEKTNPVSLQHASSFSLSALFLGLSTAAVLSGLLTPAFRSDQDSEEFLETLLVTAGSGVSLAFWCWIFTWAFTWSLRSSLVGMVAGLVWGGSIAAVLLLPEQQAGTACMTMLLGSGAMLVVAVIGRKRKSSPMPDAKTAS